MKQYIYMALCGVTLLHAEAPKLLPVDKRTFSQSQYMPDISLVVDMSYASRSKEQDELAGLVVPGLIEDYYGQEEDAHGHSHGAYGSDNGFNFNYAELILSSNVDPNFSLDAIFHFDVDSVEIEEAYFTNTTFMDGLRIRGGKMLSEFGRINRQHQHFWDFNEMPLIYQGFLGSEGLSELGLQFQYTLPLDEYVMIGTEVLQGDNEKTFGNESITLVNGTAQADIKGATAPSVLVAYLKTSFDIGDTTVMPGFSYIYGQSRLYHDHDGHEVAFEGTASIYNLELTVKHYFDSYSFLTWQSEWMHLDREGSEYHNEGTANPNVIEVEAQKISQEGLYTQLVYAHDQNWRMGARYEYIYKNDYLFSEDPLPSTPYSSYSAMVEYHWSEFSRLRLEYTHNDALYSETTSLQEDVNTLMLSLNLAIGAHGAHDF